MSGVSWASTEILPLVLRMGEPDVSRVWSLWHPGLCGQTGVCWPRCLTTPSLSADLWRTEGLRQDPRRQVAGARFVPDAAQQRHAQLQDHLPRLPLPAHPRTLETLREHRLARRIGHAAADRQPPPAIARVVHPPRMPPQVAIRLPERLP